MSPSNRFDPRWFRALRSRLASGSAKESTRPPLRGSVIEALEARDMPGSLLAVATLMPFDPVFPQLGAGESGTSPQLLTRWLSDVPLAKSPAGGATHAPDGTPKGADATPVGTSLSGGTPRASGIDDPLVPVGAKGSLFLAPPDPVPTPRSDSSGGASGFALTLSASADAPARVAMPVSDAAPDAMIPRVPTSTAPNVSAPRASAPTDSSPASAVLAPRSVAPVPSRAVDFAPSPQATSPSGAAPTALERSEPAAPLSAQARIGFNHTDLNGWDVTVAGGTDAGKGSARPGSALLKEGDSFLVGLERSFVVPVNPAPLVFTYTDLSFDTSDPDSIRDAFEVSLVDATGAPLASGFTTGRDAFFNVTEDIGAATGPGVARTGDAVRTVTLDMAGVLPGTQATLRFRLVNNDRDTGTQVRILDVLVPSANNSPQVTGIANRAGQEGAAVTIQTTFTDPDPGAAHTAVVAWGDGTTSPATVTPTGAGTFAVSATHVYADNGTYQARLTVADDQNALGEAAFVVNVSNVAPTVTAGVSFQRAASGSLPAVVLSGAFSDPGFTRTAAGATETFTAEVAWGDGSVTFVPVVVTAGAEGRPSTGRYSVAHAYAQAGVYTARVTVRDDDQGAGAADSRAGVARLDVTRNLDLAAGGSVPVLVLRDPGFDATKIDAGTVRFAPAGARPANNVMQVRATDVRFNFAVAQTGAHQGDTSAFLTGRLTDGTPFASVAPVTVVGGAALPAAAAPAGTKFFVADAAADRSYRYAASGAAAGSFALDVVARDPRGAASNAAGDKVWVIDGTTHAVTVQGPNGALLGYWRADGLQSPTGVTTDGTDVWVVDAGAKKVSRYLGAAALLSGGSVAQSLFALHADNANPSDLVTDGQVIWVTDEVRDEVFVYSVAGALLGRWKLDPRNADASGITRDPTGQSADLWVVDRVDRVVYTYAGAAAWRDGSRTASGTFALAAGNTQPEGIADPPDLAIRDVSAAGLTYDRQALTVSGSATVKVTNTGTAPTAGTFSVSFFEDRNRNQRLDPAEDSVLGSVTVTSSVEVGGSVTVSAALSGSVQFAGSALWAVADAEGVVAELDETNNIGRSSNDLVPVVGQFDPVIEWQKSTFNTLSGSDQVLATPAVMDLDADGIADVVFSTYVGVDWWGNGTLRAVRGSDGQEMWTVTDPLYQVAPGGSFALGNIDADPAPEIVAVHESGALVAFESDGTFKWKTSYVVPSFAFPGFGTSGGGPSLADLDADGTAEIIVANVVFNANGTLRWAALSGGTGNNWLGPVSAVADLDLDGRPEVVAGRTAYRADGTVYWNAPVATDGFNAIANFDADPFPEVVLVTSGSVYLLEHTGSVKWGPVPIPGLPGLFQPLSGGAPTVADLDGDGLPEIGVAGASKYFVLETDGTIKWQVDISDRTSHATGSTVFDFEGDGRAELIYGDEFYLRIYRGTDGAVLYQLPKTSVTWYELPVVADVDGDGNAEIIAVANGAYFASYPGLPANYPTQTGLVVIGDRNDTWVSTRPLWNQHTYHITNVNDDGTIPAVEQNSWQVHNTYRLNAPPEPLAAPDLTASFLRASGAFQTATVTARVGNGGTLFTPAGVRVAFYDGDPSQGGRLLGGTATTRRLNPGEFEDVSITTPRAAIQQVWVVVDDDGTGRGSIREPNETNNAHQAALTYPPPQVTLSAPVSGASLRPGQRVLVSGKATALRPDLGGNASSLPNRVVAVWVNGQPVDALDADGNFFTLVEIQLGQNRFEVTATDLYDRTNRTQVTVQGSPAPTGPDFSLFSDVSGSLAAEYGRTSYRVGSKVLYADVAVRNTGQYPVDAPLLVGIKNISDPTVRVRGADGTTPDGVPYFDLSSLIAGGVLPPNGLTGFKTISFYNPSGERFTYELVFLGKLNQAPAVTSIPDVEALAGRAYRYDVDATDPDADPLTYALVTAPSGMTINASTGVITWTPTAANIGTHAVTVRVEDGRGGSTEQRYALAAITPPPNRPPVFTSVPAVDAIVGRPYTYDADARDADDDALTYALVSGPAGLAIDPQTGVLAWVPTAAQLSDQAVTVSVSDGAGGAATQAFIIRVGADPNNRPPVITSEPVTTVVTGRPYTYDVNASDADNDSLTYSLIQAPRGMTIDPESGTIDWRPTFTTSLSNSGVDRSGNPLPIGSLDPHWEIVDGPGITTPVPAVVTNQYPYAENSESNWVWVNASGNGGANATYTFRQTFDLTGYDLSTVVISGAWGADNFGAIRLNGDTPAGTGTFSLHGVSYWNFGVLYDFRITGGFIQGVNTLDFVITDADNLGALGVTGLLLSGEKSGLPFPVTVRVEDGRGGADEQSFTITVAEQAGEISGTVFDDVNGNGRREQIGRLFVAHDVNTLSPSLAGAQEERFAVNVAEWLIGGRSGSILAFGVPGDEKRDYSGGVLTALSAAGFAVTLTNRLDFTPAQLSAYDAVFVGMTYSPPPFPAAAALTEYMYSGGNVYVYGGVYTDFRVEHRGWDGFLNRFGLSFAVDAGPGLYGYNGLLDPVTITSTHPVFRGVTRLQAGNGSTVIDLDVADPRNQLLAFANSKGIYAAYENVIDNELVLAGRVVYLDQNRNGRRDTEEPFTTTDVNGNYTFIDLVPGSYSVALEGRSGWEQTAPAGGVHAISLSEGQTVTGRDFGIRATVATNNRSPLLTGSPPTAVTAGAGYRYASVASDPDGDALTFDLPVKPAGMTIDPVTGVVAWVPTREQIGAHDVTLRVQDGKGGYDVHPFTITVRAPNTAPAITSSPAVSAAVGRPYRYQVRAQDADGDALAYRLEAAPAGMTIDAGAGLISWTPTGAQAGPHTVRVIVSDGRGGEAVQQFVLSAQLNPVNRAPVVTADPRTTVAIGNRYTYQPAATDPDGDPLTYTLTTAPNGMAVGADGLVTWTPTAAQVGANPVVLRVTDGRGGAVEKAFAVVVGAVPVNRPPVVVSNPPASVVLGGTYAYNAQATDPDGDPLVWDLVTGPAGMSVDPDTGAVRWSPVSSQVGPHAVRLRVTDGQGGISEQSFTVTVRGANRPPQITSAPPTAAAAGAAFTYAVRASDPEGDALTFSVVGPPAMTIDPGTGLVRWTPTAADTGVHEITVLVSDGRATTAQTFDVEVSAAAPNRAPVIGSAPPAAATVGALYTYPVTATDPDGDRLTYRLDAAPAGMTIDPATGLVSWTPTAGQTAPQRVTVVVTDPSGAGAGQTFTLTPRTNAAPSISSAPVTAATPGAAYWYDVRATDPDGDRLTYELITGPAGMTMDANGRVRWTPPPGTSGNVPVSVRVSDGRGGTVTQAYSVILAPDVTAPQVALQVSTNPAPVGLPVTVVVTATDNVGVAALGLTVNGRPVVLDALGRASVTPTATGPLTLVATATDAAGNVGTFPLTLSVIDPSDVDAPVAALTAPADGAVLTGPADVRGTVTDTNLVYYALSYARVGSDTFTEFARGTAPVTNGVLGRFDPSVLSNDAYVLRLFAVDAGGHESVDERVVSVAGDLKLGNFALSFTDLTVPVQGVPITVTRTYDSLNAGAADELGFGWRVEFRDTDLRTSVEPTGAEADGFYNAFRSGTRVYVTLPGGKREGFTFKPTLAPGLRGSFLGIYQAQFVPDAGVYSTLGVESFDLTAFSDGSFGSYGGGLPYNPADPAFGGAFYLTTRDGLVYTINGATGDLETVADPNGNTLTFTADAVVSSAGPKVTFERDPRGRISAVVDPSGLKVRYAYDLAGDLVAVTDREGNVTRFKYEEPRFPHYLTQVIDPLGRTGVRTEYDAQGRMVKLLDADGKFVELVHSPGQFTETVKDQLGNVTTYVYDARGNVTREVNAEGEVTERTYDANNNTLTETKVLADGTRLTAAMSYDAQGNVLTETDPLGNVTRYTYQTVTPRSNLRVALAPFSLQRTVTDPLGNTTTNDYDAAGNLLKTTDPSGVVTAFAYDPSGNPTSITVGGGAMTFAYDGAGRVLTQTDAAGTPTVYTYDQNGDQLTATTRLTTPGGVRTLVTATEYDANGRAVKVTDAEGGVSRTEYDAAGNRTASVDALGRRTEFRYSDRGELTETIFPDATPATLTDNPRTRTEYDAAGRTTAQIDEAGRRTEMRYDKTGRPTETIYPDATPATLADNPRTKTEYDDAGRTTAQIDERGNRTAFEYDLAGRQTVVRDALGHETATAYDAVGRQTAVTDALGHVTRFVRDAGGRPTKTIYADGTDTESGFDTFGRLTSKTDQLDRVTRYEYDASGRLKAVVDALNQRTEYGYDEAGNLVTQKDANGHVTKYEYDGLGRRTATVLPLGQRSAIEYDPVGQVKRMVDFNGQALGYTYDARGRLTGKAFANGTSVAFTYTPVGERSTYTDARGTTTWAYDERGRLVGRTEPDGQSIGYAYDTAGNRTGLTTAAGTVRYTFDALNRMKTVTDPDGGVTTYAYNEVGNLVRTDLPNGTWETRGYDDLNRLTVVEHRNASGVLARFAYTLAATGRRDAVTEPGRSVAYTYDALDRLTGESITDPSAGNRTIGYVYDPVGNRRTRTDTVEGATSYAYDDNDRLLTETTGAGATAYTYDANGNTLSKSGPDGRVGYVWDQENQLVGADTDGNGTTDVVNVYDADGIRVSQTAGGQETRYLIDQVQPYQQVALEYRPSGLIVVEYVRGLGLISQDRGGAKSFFHADGLGSTRALTSMSGAVTDRYVYEAFGRTIGQTGSTANGYLFAGEQRDAATGLDYLRARYLDPASGRLFGRDPFAGVLRKPVTQHPFMYAAANPVNFRDPSGRFLVGISVSLSINATLADIQSAFAKAGMKAISQTFFVANTVLKPAATLQELGLAMITNDLPGGESLYNAGRQLTAAGFQSIGAALRDIYIETAKSLVTFKVEPFVSFGGDMDLIIQSINNIDEFLTDVAEWSSDILVALSDDYPDQARLDALVNIGQKLIDRVGG